MSERVTDYRSELLLSLVAAIETLGEQPCRDPHDLYGYRAYGVPYRPAHWLDRRPTKLESRCFSRVARDLESEGLIVRVAGGIGDRTTHLRPTPQLAAQIPTLSEGEVDLSMVARGFAQTAWGEACADATRRLMQRQSSTDRRDSAVAAL